MLPYVSVIVPCLNRREWLKEAVTALRSQDYPSDRFEIIVVDNGSKDGTWEWLQTASTDPGVPLRCFRNQTPYKTHGGSRNVGLGYARGEIIAFTDSDCIAQSDWISKGVAHFEEAVGIVVGRTSAPPNAQAGPLSRIRVIEGEKFFDTCNIFYRREALDRAGGFATDMPQFTFMAAGDDSELAVRVKKLGYGSVFAADAVIIHRIREQTPWQWLIEPRTLLAVPYFVKKHPHIRDEMLVLRYFLSPLTALFDLLLLGLVLGFAANRWFILLSLPYLLAKMIDGGKHLRPAMRVLRVFAGSVRAGITFVVLLYASIRFRSLVI